MKVGLIDIDGHNFPNLALMKISAYHKALGDSVEWVNHFERYDRVYQSKVFTFTPDNVFVVYADEIIRGGTGYDYKVTLPMEIDRTKPDYSLYPKFTEAYGFLTRGCTRKCHWCIVPKKEGQIRSYMDITEVAGDRKEVILMDNNILACDYGIKQIEKIIDLGLKVDFNQGLDARLITPEVAELLSRVRWIRFIRTSCDTLANMKSVERAIETLNSVGIKNYRIWVYVLLQDLSASYEIINWLKGIGCVPFAQPYRDFTPFQIIPQWQLDMAQWVNKKSNVNSCDFKDYRPRKNFKCDEYFKIRAIA